jgi:hypothetical protein
VLYLQRRAAGTGDEMLKRFPNGSHAATRSLLLVLGWIGLMLNGLSVGDAAADAPTDFVGTVSVQ